MPTAHLRLQLQKPIITTLLADIVKSTPKVHIVHLKSLDLWVVWWRTPRGRTWRSWWRWWLGNVVIGVVIQGLIRIVYVQIESFCRMVERVGILLWRYGWGLWLRWVEWCGIGCLISSCRIESLWTFWWSSFSFLMLEHRSSEICCGRWSCSFEVVAKGHGIEHTEKLHTCCQKLDHLTESKRHTGISATISFTWD